MLKEISLAFLGELRTFVVEDKIKNLSIAKEDDKYIADYSLIEEGTVGANLRTISKVSNELQTFSTALLLDKVEKFELHYNPSKDLSVINSEYEIIVNEDSHLEKMRILNDSLDKILSLTNDLDLSHVKIDNLYEKLEGKNKKIRYVSASVNECIKSLVKVLN